MQTRTIAIILLVLGILMMAYTGFNYITTERVVDLGPLHVNKEVNHPVQWSPIIGVILLAGGLVLLLTGKREKV